MANKTTINQNKSTDSSDTDDSTNIKRAKRSQYSLSQYQYKSLRNIMQFIEIQPLNSQNSPHPRSGHRAIATDSDFWIWGGYFPTNNLVQSPMFAELWRFNYALRQWTLETTTGDAPISTLASHSMYLHRNHVFVFGGTGYPFGAVVSNHLYVLDLKRLHWKRISLEKQPPEAVYGASMVGKGDYLYILCGTSFMHYHSDVYEVHLPTLNSTHIGHTFNEQEDVAGNGRYRQEAFLYEDQIFLFGGSSDNGSAFSFHFLPVFDLNTHNWSFIRTNPDPIHNFPAARKFHSIFPFHKNQILMFGGADLSFITSQHVATDGHLWIFDFEKLEWHRSPSLSMVRPTYFHAAAINERGEIWSHGGVVETSLAAPNETRITTLYKMDSQVPHLRELCWSSFLNCLSDRTCLINQRCLLKQLHIPEQFIERIH